MMVFVIHEWYMHHRLGRKACLQSCVYRCSEEDDGGALGKVVPWVPLCQPGGDEMEDRIAHVNVVVSMELSASVGTFD